VDRAATSVQQMLAFSKQQRVSHESIDAVEFIGGIAGKLRQCLSPHVTLRFQLSPSADAVMADRPQLEQVLTSIVANAGEATPAGGHVLIASRVVSIDPESASVNGNPSEGRYLVIEISDTGSGMSAEVRQHLFEPFFTTKPAATGAGLGLAASHGIVRSMGGEITAYSEEGLGSTLRVYLPTCGEILPEPRSVPLEVRNCARAGETVLVVDDEDGVREVAARILANGGYRVLQAANGIEAIQTLEDSAQVIDLVLSDLVMPIMGGQELLSHVRERWPEKKVLLTSGYSAELLQADGEGGPGAPVLQKPYDIVSLTCAVRDILAEKA
jgi:CheY-like chemotaxis protein